MESGNQTSDTDSDGEQNIPSFTKLSLIPSIDTDKENKVISISQASNHKQCKKLTKLLKRYTERKEELIKNTKDLHKVSSILRRDKRQTICFEEYSKLSEKQGICKIIDKKNYINISLPQEINTMKKQSKYSVEELEDLKIYIISNCENEHENIEEFLLSFGSTKIKGLRFQGNSNLITNENHESKNEHCSYFKVYPCSSYICGLRDVISKATIAVWINSISLNSKEFSSIVRAAKHVKILFLTRCKIITDGECELGEMEGCQIEYLTVDCYYHSYKRSRGYEDSCMKIFLSILGYQNLLRSLRKIEFKCERNMGERLLFKAKEILGSDYDMQMLIIED